MKRVIVVLLITTLCACAAAPSSGNKDFLKGIGNKWVGRPLDDLIFENGSPDEIRMLAGGGRVFEYSNPVDVKAGSQPPSAKAFFGDPRGQRIREKRKRLESDQAQDCKVLFTISATDIIESWSTESCG